MDFIKQSLPEINDLIRENRASALREAKKEWDFPFFRSRGVMLCTADASGDHIGPNSQGEAPYWNGTKKEIKNLIKNVLENHPNVAEIYLTGGWDGADNVREMADGCYEPWCGSWTITVWKRP